MRKEKQLQRKAEEAVAAERAGMSRKSLVRRVRAGASEDGESLARGVARMKLFRNLVWIQ